MIGSTIRVTAVSLVLTVFRAGNATSQTPGVPLGLAETTLVGMVPSISLEAAVAGTAVPAGVRLGIEDDRFGAGISVGHYFRPGPASRGGVDAGAALGWQLIKSQLYQTGFGVRAQAALEYLPPAATRTNERRIDVPVAVGITLHGPVDRFNVAVWLAPELRLRWNGSKGTAGAGFTTGFDIVDANDPSAFQGLGIRFAYQLVWIDSPGLPVKSESTPSLAVVWRFF